MKKTLLTIATGLITVASSSAALSWGPKSNSSFEALNSFLDSDPSYLGSDHTGPRTANASIFYDDIVFDSQLELYAFGAVAGSPNQLGISIDTDSSGTFQTFWIDPWTASKETDIAAPNTWYIRATLNEIFQANGIDTTGFENSVYDVKFSIQGTKDQDVDSTTAGSLYQFDQELLLDGDAPASTAAIVADYGIFGFEGYRKDPTPGEPDFNDFIFAVRDSREPITTEVPEPSTYGLIGAAALVGLIARRRITAKKLANK